MSSLRRAAGGNDVKVMPFVTGSEDFAYYGQKAPAFFYFVGVTPKGQDPATAPSNHSPLFFVDEGALPVAVRTILGAAVDYLQGTQPN